LKAASGWNDNENGTDDYGFSALPGGGRFDDAGFGNAGDNGFWWTATVSEYNSDIAWYRYILGSHDDFLMLTAYKSWGFSVRCVAD
jgi:uncharacterized protein (TIGR02145 family)